MKSTVVICMLCSLISGAALATGVSSLVLPVEARHRFLAQPSPSSSLSGLYQEPTVGKLCPEEETAYLTCLITNQFNDFNSCVDCLNSQWPEEKDEGYLKCNDLSGYLCDAPYTCNCDPCIEDIGAFYDCYYYFCDRDELCALEPADTTEEPSETTQVPPVTTNAPPEATESTPTAECSDEVDQVSSCISSCLISRRLSSKHEDETQSKLLRGAIETTETRKLFETAPFVTPKTTWTEALTASSVETEGQRCSAEQSAYLECFALELSRNQVDECASCLNDSLPDGAIVTSCNAMEDLLCIAPYECNCGSCVDEIQAFNNCWYTLCDSDELCSVQSQENTSSECTSELDPMKACVNACFE